MATSTDEWLRQADYDLETAEFMLQGGRRFYAAFMAHLAVEKALKGLFLKRMNQVPPKTHNLTMLLDAMSVTVPADRRLFLTDLTAAQVPAGTRRTSGGYRPRLPNLASAESSTRPKR